MLKFYWNGIKEDGGKLQRAWYSFGNLLNHPADTITIYGRDYKSFSAGVQAAFVVENDSDMQTDYFEQDRIRVHSDHPLYAEVFAAYEKAQAHSKARHVKWVARHGLQEATA